MAHTIISRIPEQRRIKKQWSPRRDDQGNFIKGRAEKINSIDSLDLSEDKWLILGRSKNKLDEIAKKLRTKSLYFETKFGKSYNQKATVQSQTGGTFVIQNLDSPATTSTLTYKGRLQTDSSSYNARIGAGGNNGTQNIPESVITLLEESA